MTDASSQLFESRRVVDHDGQSLSGEFVGRERWLVHRLRRSSQQQALLRIAHVRIGREVLTTLKYAWNQLRTS
jgi:hypothetical protein